MTPKKTFAIILLTCSTAAYAQEGKPAEQLTPATTPGQAAATLALDPAGFAKEAAAANAFEILSSEVALRRGLSPEVKAFAQTMIDDHRRAQRELHDSATSDNVSLSEDLSMEQRQTLLALEQAEESQFDSAYLSAQMKAHDQAIQLLGSYAADGPPGGLKTYATAHYPAVRNHMVRAQSLTSQ
jgi:putative membrane protein